MLPILISEKQNIGLIFKVLAIKIAIGILAGTLIDLVLRLTKKHKEQEDNNIEAICEHEHCNCEKEGILKSSIKHTVSIFLFILAISFVLNVIINFIGNEKIESIISNNLFLGPVLASLIGLIPNCASSVVLTQMYLDKFLNLATMISGLLVNAGLGFIVLFKVNKNIKQNIMIVITMYLIGVFSGIALNFIL
jgi:hypothetical protein